MTKREIKSEPRDYAKLNNPRFMEIWDEWLADRKERRKPVTKRAAEMQLQFLATQPDPIACVKQSIAKGYQGIFALAVKQPDRQQPRYGDSARDLYVPREKVSSVKPLSEIMTECRECGKMIRLGDFDSHRCEELQKLDREKGV